MRSLNPCPRRPAHDGRAYLFDSGPGVVRRAAAAAERLKIAALQAPRLNRVFLHQLIRSTTDKAPLQEVRKDYRGRVVSAHDLDLY